MVKLGSVECTHGVAMGIDMNQSDWRFPAQGLENGVRDGVVAAHRQRPHAAGGQFRIVNLNVLDGLFQTVAAAERNVADVRRPQGALRHHAKSGVVGADPFDGSNGTRPESGSWSIGHAEVHRHPNDRHIQAGRIRCRRQSQESRYARVGFRSLAVRRLHLPSGFDQYRIVAVLEALAVRKSGSQILELRWFHLRRSFNSDWQSLTIRRVAVRIQALRSPGKHPGPSEVLAGTVKYPGLSFGTRKWIDICVDERGTQRC